MVQKIVLGALSGTGIVAVLIVSGVFMKGTELSQSLGEVAMSGGVFIALALGLLGVVGVLRRVL